MTRQEKLLLAGIVAVGALVRFATLDVQSLHHDEAVTAARVIQPSLFDTLNTVADGERSPPLYYVLAWLWSRPFGTGEVGLRSLSALAGTLTIPVAFLVGRELARSARVGLLTAAFVALNPYLVWYSQEARSYGMLVLFSTVALLFFVRAARDGSTRNLALWAGASALALASHYFSVFLIAPQALWLAWVAAERLRTALAVAAVVAVGLALLPLADHQERGDRRNAFTDVSLSTRAAETGLNFVASEEPDPLAGDSRIDRLQVLAGACGALFLAIALGLLAGRAPPDERHAALLVGLVAASAIALPFLLGLVGLDYANPRNMIGGLVPLLAVCAVGLGGREAGRLGPAVAILGCLLFAGVLAAVNTSAQMQRPDWREAAETIGPATHRRVLVLPQNGDDPLIYYLGVHRFAGSRFEDGSSVREIDVLSTSYAVRPPAPGFHLVDREGLAPLFIVSRYRSQRPRTVSYDEIQARHPIAGRSTVMIDGLPER
jgi:mannosyltransferase